MKTWKNELEIKGPRVNMGKTKRMPCGKRQDTRVNIHVSVELDLLWNLRDMGYIRNAMELNRDLLLSLTSSASNALG